MFQKFWDPYHYTESSHDTYHNIASHDEALKNLMMSWYWAGYYTGLYEGQKLPKPSAAADQPMEVQK